MKIKKIAANALASVSYKLASMSANTASREGFSQPKEPEAIAKLRKKK